MIISIDIENAFEKIQHLFVIKKISAKLYRGNIPQHNKGHV